MITFLLEVALQSAVCFLGFLAGILYAKDRYMPLIRHLKSQLPNTRQNGAEFRAGKVWYRQTPY